MQKIILTKGLPASGKSTWANQYVKDNPGWVNICADDIRNEYFKDVPFSKSKEKAVFEKENELIRFHLENGWNIIVSDTNLHSRHWDRVKEIKLNYESISHNDVLMEWKEFDTPLPIVIERDKKRENKVGEDVILRMWRQYYTPMVSKWDDNKKRAYICDLDGTLCLFGGDVSPYDRDFSKDYPNQPLIELLQTIKMRYSDDVEIIYTSGRFQKFQKITEKWLFDNNCPTGKLLMRPDDDKSHDYEYKLKRYREDIEPYYNIAGVWDDRNQVIHLWRWLGLPTYQVNYGNF